MYSLPSFVNITLTRPCLISKFTTSTQFRSERLCKMQIERLFSICCASMGNRGEPLTAVVSMTIGFFENQKPNGGFRPNPMTFFDTLTINFSSNYARKSFTQLKLQEKKKIIFLSTITFWRRLTSSIRNCQRYTATKCQQEINALMDAANFTSNHCLHLNAFRMLNSVAISNRNRIVFFRFNFHFLATIIWR